MNRPANQSVFMFAVPKEGAQDKDEDYLDDPVGKSDLLPQEHDEA